MDDSAAVASSIDEVATRHTIQQLLAEKQRLLEKKNEDLTRIRLRIDDLHDLLAARTEAAIVAGQHCPTPMR